MPSKSCTIKYTDILRVIVEHQSFTIGNSEVQFNDHVTRAMNNRGERTSIVAISYVVFNISRLFRES